MRIAIIGGGPGGYEAALVAAQLGAEVVVAETLSPEYAEKAEALSLAITKTERLLDLFNSCSRICGCICRRNSGRSVCRDGNVFDNHYFRRAWELHF